MTIAKSNYRSKATITKMSAQLCTEFENTILNFSRKHKRPKIAKKAPNDKNIARGITIPDFKLLYRTLEIKAQCADIKPDPLINRLELRTTS